MNLHTTGRSFVQHGNLWHLGSGDGGRENAAEETDQETSVYNLTGSIT
jgi:hypothetical protein